MSLKKIIQYPMYIDREFKTIIRFLEKMGKSNIKILDVGCGFGRVQRGLKDRGFDVVGVEVNQDIVARNKNSGLSCLTVEEFKKNTDQYDVILMCHIIEHFAPRDLLNFMDFYLERLKPQGHLIISTPLLTQYFYDDFDHIKPYSPTGLKMVFGESSDSQVQYYSKNKLELKDIWFRKSHFRFSHSRAKYVKSPWGFFMKFIELISAYTTYLTFGFFGKCDGWVGLYRKL